MIVVTAMASGERASWAAVCPMTMYSESGDGSAASPIWRQPPGEAVGERVRRSAVQETGQPGEA